MPYSSPIIRSWIGLSLSIIALFLTIIALVENLLSNPFDKFIFLYEHLHFANFMNVHHRVFLLVVTMSLCGFVGALAQRIVAADNQRSSGRAVKSTPWWSWMGSLLVGAVAANALHFPLAAVFDYTSLLTGAAAKPFLSILALALLAGYAGPSLLEALAKKFQDSVAVKLEELLKRNEDIVDRTLKTLIEDILTRRITPNATDRELLRAKYAELQIREGESGIEVLSSIDALVAGYYMLEIENYHEAVRYMEYADSRISSLETNGLKWACKNLLGLSYQYDSDDKSDWFKKAIEAHQKALGFSVSSTQRAITLVNMAFAKKDKGELESAMQDLSKAQAISDISSEDIPLFQGVAKVCEATLLTLKLISTNGSGGPIDLRSVAAVLGDVRDPQAIEYLFKDHSIEQVVLKAWQSDPVVPKSIRDLIR